MYSNIRSRAGLVALVFALISISLVSAFPIPIPVPQPDLSSALSSRSTPSRNGEPGLIQPDTHRIAKILSKAQMSRAPAAVRALAGKHNLLDTDDDQLLRRNVFSKIKQGFQKLGHAIKSAAQKVGSGIKKAAQKVGGGIKKVAQKVGSGIKKAAQKVGGGIKKVAQKVGSGIKKAAQKVGAGIKKVAQKVGSGIKKVAQKVGSGIKKAAQKVGSGIKTAAKKVGQFMKTTGAKIAKFGLQVVDTVGTAVGKVASFIPDVGKPLERAIVGVSKVAGVVSDKIHTNLSPKLQKGMNVMKKADKIMGYIPRRRDLSEEEAFQQRDTSDGYYFEEPADISLDHQEDDDEYYLDLEGICPT
jgi:hypothetical protein